MNPSNKADLEVPALPTKEEVMAPPYSVLYTVENYFKVRSFTSAEDRQMWIGSFCTAFINNPDTRLIALFRGYLEERDHEELEEIT